MKNDYIVHEDLVEMLLERKTDGLKMSTFVSKRHLPKLMEHKHRWYLKWDKSAKCYYVYCRVRRGEQEGSFFLHRWLINAERGLVVDHINHDTMDNTDGNLRQVDRVINGMNRRGANCNNKTSGKRNVHFNTKLNKWSVFIVDQGKTKNYGHYESVEEAEKAAIIAREAIYARKAV